MNLCLFLRCLVKSIILFLHFTPLILFANQTHNNYPEDLEKAAPKNADLIIYSYNRPMQLFALLESIELLVSGINTIHIIYKTDNHRYKQAYEIVKKRFGHAVFIKQKNKSPDNFKELTLESLSALKSDYILFAVDDDIVTHSVNLSECIALMEKTNSYGFYLRLGKNISYCYSLNKVQKTPLLKTVNEYVYSWQFKTGEYDWNYPNTLDMTIYRKFDLAILAKLRFQNPNELESRWTQQAQKVQHRTGLCYENSKIVNLPLNKVQTTFNNRSMNSWKPDELLHLFEQGFKISKELLIGIKNISVHMEYEPTFTTR